MRDHGREIGRDRWHNHGSDDGCNYGFIGARQCTPSLHLGFHSGNKLQSTITPGATRLHCVLCNARQAVMLFELPVQTGMALAAIAPTSSARR